MTPGEKEQFDALEAQLRFYKDRETHFIKALGVPDNGQWRNDWDDLLKHLIAVDVALAKKGVVMIPCKFCGSLWPHPSVRSELRTVCFPCARARLPDEPEEGVPDARPRSPSE